MALQTRPMARASETRVLRRPGQSTHRSRVTRDRWPTVPSTGRDAGLSPFPLYGVRGAPAECRELSYLVPQIGRKREDGDRRRYQREGAGPSGGRTKGHPARSAGQSGRNGQQALAVASSGA